MGSVVNIHEAKTAFSRLVRQLRDGTAREFVIAVSGKPYARLVAYEAPKKRVLGIDEGLVTIAGDFDADNERISDQFTGN